ncbi:MAG: Bug family tripartite tricarboxylate transporter substrate binding protein [Lautropia sp.]
MRFPSLVALALGALVTVGANAQGTIRVINQFGPGGGADAIVRPLVERVGSEMGRTVIIDHKPGASGTIAAAELEKGAPDGSTLIIDTQTLSVNSVLRKVNYRHSEWEPVALLAQIPLALLTAKELPANSLAELVAYARKNPGKVTYATLGPGSAAHLAGLRFERAMDLKLLPVPYKSTSDVHQDLLGGRIDVFFDGVTQALPRLQGGQLKILGLSTGSRLPAAPQLPTFKEQGFDMEVGSWFGIAAPKGTPPDLVAKLSDAFVKAQANPDYKKRMEQQGVIVHAMGPQQFASFRKEDQARWAELIKSANLVIE